MRPTTAVRVVVLASLLAALPAASKPHAPKTPPAVMSAPCEPLPGPPPDAPPHARDTIGLNFPSRTLAMGDTTVQVCVLVDSTGIVREARVARGGTPCDSAAVDAVRWWLFAPARRDGRPVAARITLGVAVRPPRDADPLVPDVLGMALAAEASGDRRGALDAWTGTLARAGVHPTIGNEWAIREHILRLAAALTPPLPVPDAERGEAKAAHNRMERDMSRGTNADLAHALDAVLAEAPWYVDAYRWRASARAASGQRAGAVRDVMCYRLATRDSLGRAVADRALAALAAGDTIAALTMLKND